MQKEITDRSFLLGRLKELRGDRSKAAFAGFLGIAPAVYNRYKEGRLPTADNLSVIAERCDVTIDWLLGRTESRYIQDGCYAAGPWQKIGPRSQRELLFTGT